MLKQCCIDFIKEALPIKDESEYYIDGDIRKCICGKWIRFVISDKDKKEELSIMVMDLVLM